MKNGCLQSLGSRFPFCSDEVVPGRLLDHVADELYVVRASRFVARILRGAGNDDRNGGFRFVLDIPTFEGEVLRKTFGPMSCDGLSAKVLAALTEKSEAPSGDGFVPDQQPGVSGEAD